MRIQFLTSVAGANFAFDEGEEADLPEATARDFVRGGVARALEAGTVAGAVTGALGRVARRVARRGAKAAELAVGGSAEAR